MRRQAWDMTAVALIGRFLMRQASTKRTRKKKGRRGLRPWPLRYLSQYLFERKERLLRLLRISVHFTDGVDMYL